MSRKRLIAILLIAFTAQPPAYSEPVADAPALDESGKFRLLLDTIWQWRLNRDPEFATEVGYPGNNDRWMDLSLKTIGEAKQQQREFLRQLHQINANALSRRGQLDLELITWQFEMAVAAQQYYQHYLQINQLSGVHQTAEYILSNAPKSKLSDVEDMLKRLERLPKRVEQTQILLKQGQQKGITPPKVTLRDVKTQIMNLFPVNIEQSPLYKPFIDMPGNIENKQQKKLQKKAQTLLKKKVYPAFTKLANYLETDYIPNAREEVALSAIPNGTSWYQHQIKYHTSTSLNASEIHAIGLAEVERIEKEMRQIIQDSAFEGDRDAFVSFTNHDSRFFFTSPDELVVAYRDITKRADPELPKLFKTLPRLTYGVKAMPAYAEKSAPAAYYFPGANSVGRPGYFLANTYDLKARPKWEMEALSLHEAVPGHHLQIAIAQELDGVHELLKHTHHTAFVEGWALYAESLGTEMGFYQDAYSKFGQLNYEMWRAIRLVIDTGIHALGWTRQQAIDFFKQHSAKPQHDIIVEVDRYIVWPGQALAYKIGELKIKELRLRAEQMLGETFNIREFHDQVLQNGSVTLEVLEEVIDQWIAVQQGELVKN